MFISMKCHAEHLLGHKSTQSTKHCYLRCYSRFGEKVVFKNKVPMMKISTVVFTSHQQNGSLEKKTFTGEICSLPCSQNYLYYVHK